MTAYGQAPNTDVNGIVTSAKYADPGDAVDVWFHEQHVVDGGDVAQGGIADTAVVDDTASATVIALLKGILVRQNALASTASYASSAVAPAAASTVAAATNLVVKAAAGRLRSFVGYSTVTQYIQVHDATSLPADTAVPLVVFPIVADTPFSIDFGATGLPCGTGIVLCVSTTGVTKTIGAANTMVTAIYQ